VRSSTSTVVVVNPALFNRDGASVGSVVSPSLNNYYLPQVDEKEKRSGDILIIGDTLFAIPPLLSCSANWIDVLPSAPSLSTLKTYLNSNRLSPPSTAPTNTPSGFRRCLTCVKAPTISPTQCKPPAETIAST
jgi:hypothetical protein